MTATIRQSISLVKKEILVRQDFSGIGAIPGSTDAKRNIGGGHWPESQ